MSSFIFLEKILVAILTLAAGLFGKHNASTFKIVVCGASICFNCFYLQEAKKGMATAGKVNVTPVEEKVPDDEPLVYANKLVIF